MADIRFVQPGILRLPPERDEGADPFKLAAQIKEFGDTFMSMPPVLVLEGADNELQIYDGVTRAIRAYRVDPFTVIAVEVTVTMSTWDLRFAPTIAEVVTGDFF